MFARAVRLRCSGLIRCWHSRVAHEKLQSSYLYLVELRQALKDDLLSTRIRVGRRHVSCVPTSSLMAQAQHGAHPFAGFLDFAAEDELVKNQVDLHEQQCIMMRVLSLRGRPPYCHPLISTTFRLCI